MNREKSGLTSYAPHQALQVFGELINPRLRQTRLHSRGGRGSAPWTADAHAGHSSQNKRAAGWEALSVVGRGATLRALPQGCSRDVPHELREGQRVRGGPAAAAHALRRKQALTSRTAGTPAAPRGRGGAGRSPARTGSWRTSGARRSTWRCTCRRPGRARCGSGSAPRCSPGSETGRPVSREPGRGHFKTQLHKLKTLPKVPDVLV